MWAKVGVTEKVESERSDEVTELSMKQGDGAEEGEKTQHITCKVGELDEERGEEGGSACLPLCLGNSTPLCSCTLSQSDDSIDHLL